VRAGAYSRRFELRKDDPDATSGRLRTELARDFVEKTGKRDRWYAFSIYLPLYYDYDSVAEIVTQWHAIPDRSSTTNKKIEPWRSPPLALLTHEGEWQVAFRWDAQKITVNSPEGKNRLLGPYTQGEMTDWVFHVHWSYEDDGLLEIWKNGVNVLSYNGPIGYNDDQGVYLKMGIYKWSWKSKESLTTKRVLYIDSVYVGDENATYCDVAPHSKRKVQFAPK